MKIKRLHAIGPDTEPQDVRLIKNLHSFLSEEGYRTTESYAEIYPFSWQVFRYRIDNEWLIRDFESEPYEYDPLHEKELFVEFISTNPESDSSILEFVNRRGLLTRCSREDIPDAMTVAQFKEEHGFFISFVLVYAAIGNHDFDFLKENTLKIVKTDGRPILEDDILRSARFLLRYGLMWAFDRHSIQATIWETKDGVFEPSFIVTSLIAALYVQFYQLVINSAQLGKCKECGTLFVKENKRRLFCSPVCNGRHKTKAIRRRKQQSINIGLDKDYIDEDAASSLLKRLNDNLTWEELSGFGVEKPI